MAKRRREPECAQVMRLGDVAELRIGLARVRSEDGPQRRAFLNVRDLDDGRTPPLGTLEEVVLTDRQAQTISRYEVRAGDLLLSCRGTVNKVALVAPETQGAIASANMMIIRPTRIDSRLLFAYFFSPPVRAHLESMATGSTIKAINPRDVAALEISVPPEALQRQLGDIVEASEVQYRFGVAASHARRQLGHETALACLAPEMGS